MVLECINRTSWDTKLLPTAFLVLLEDRISLCHILHEGTALLFEFEWCFIPRSAPHPLPPPPTPSCPPTPYRLNPCNYRS